MKFALVFSSLVAAVAAQTINTPESVLSCANHQVTFTGGTPPYVILVVPGGSSSAAALETYQGVQCSPFTWFVTEAAGTNVFLRLQDSAGASVSTAPFTIQAGGGNGTCTPPASTPAACGATATATGGSGGGATTSAGGSGGATTSAGGSGSSTPAPSGSSGGSGSTTASHSSSTSSTGAAFSNQVGIAGALVGFVAAGLAALA